MIITSLFEYNESYTYKHWNMSNKIYHFNKVYLVFNGTAFYKDANRLIQLKKNHLYILPANKPYSLWDDEDDKLNHLYLHITTTPVIDSFLEVDPKTNDFIKDLLILTRKTAKRPQNHKHLADLLTIIINNIFDEEIDNDTLPSRIKTYLHDNATNTFNMKKMSNYFQYSSTHLTKSFKKVFQVTPRQYHTTIRYEMVLQALKQGISCKKIAEDFNYSSPENFSRDFKKRFGLSPQKYAKKYIIK